MTDLSQLSLQDQDVYLSNLERVLQFREGMTVLNVGASC
jgi:hypothetical protein